MKRRNEAEQSVPGVPRPGCAEFTVLDPACGSGNFLYLALQALKDLEHRVQIEAETLGFERTFPEVSPANVKGIEVSPYAAELARVSVWIGEIQWMRRNGSAEARNPILKPLDTIECRDAILTAGRLRSGMAGGRRRDRQPAVPGREAADHAPGRGLRVADVLDLRRPRAGGSRPGLLLVREGGPADRLGEGGSRAGLVATNSIRGGANRRALQAATETRRIFEAWSDEPWVIDGAAVRVSLVCFSRDRRRCRVRRPARRPARR